MMRFALPLLTLLAAPAWGAEYRRITIDPGITVDAEVLATETDGFRLKVPQGVLFVSFDEVLDLAPLAGPEDVQPATWEVIVVAEEGLHDLSQAVWAELDGIELLDGTATLPPALLRRCGADPVCLATAFEEPAWRFVVTMAQQDDMVVIRSVLPGRQSLATKGANPGDPGEIRAAAMEAIELDRDDRTPDALLEAHTAWFAPTPELPDPVEEPAPVEEPEVPRWTPPKLAALSFAPVPGLPSLVNKDYAGFGASLATTVAATTGWVLATGKSTTTKAEHVGLGLAGAYVATVAANQIFAAAPFRDAQVAFQVVPAASPDGIDGAAIGVSVDW